jgi:hypothetical protein
MHFKNILILFFLIIIFHSCVDDYFPDVDKYENLLVVDGFLTNGNESVKVKLSSSSAVNNPEFLPISNADVYLTDENEIITILQENETGIYKAIDTTFKGQIGNSYQLHIKLSNGKTYVSEISSLPSPIPITSVNGEREKASKDNLYPGIRFYVENQNYSTDTLYYYWKLFQTYQYRSTFDIDYTWEGELIPNPDATALRTCWLSSKVDRLFVSSTKLQQASQNYKFPLNFVSTSTKELSIRYSLLVKQLRISKDAFNYYHSIEEQNQQQGDLWSKQPLQIIGNIKNTKDENEAVLGYFMLAGESEKRIFMDRPNIPFYYVECEPDFEGMRFIEHEPKELWPIYIDDIMFLGLARAHSRSCFDCRLDGGSLSPPSFWE